MNHRRLVLLCSLAAAVFVGGCGGSESCSLAGAIFVGGCGGSESSSTSTYGNTNLVTESTASGLFSKTTDPNLRNPWGLTFTATSQVWIANQGSNTSTLYKGDGTVNTLVVAAPGGPTGIVSNASADFRVPVNEATPATAPVAAFIFATEAGTLQAWAGNLTPNTRVVQAFAAPVGTKSYKGLAIGDVGGVQHLYATDFLGGKVDIFNSPVANTGYVLKTLTGDFTDPTLPAGYAPYGVQTVGGRVYVSYAKQDANKLNAVAGAGLGLVSVFDTSGVFIRRLVSEGGVLNAPWGLAVAPAGFGTFSGALLVANTGDGRINAFDATTGSFLGTLRTLPVLKFDNTTGKIVGDVRARPAAFVQEGLKGIAFGNGSATNLQPATTLFFTAAPKGSSSGLYGSLTLD
jgi:uncharacterized protein (TIGR03118 family)